VPSLERKDNESHPLQLASWPPKYVSRSFLVLTQDREGNVITQSSGFFFKSGARRNGY
jgi:hypothetical protein